MHINISKVENDSVYVNYVYTYVFKKVWDQFNESISSDIILKVTVKIFNTSAGFKEAKLMK
jgi:hypothetical protein